MNAKYGVTDKADKLQSFWNQYLDRYPGLDALTTRDRRRTHGRYAIRTVATMLRHCSLEHLHSQTLLDFGCGTGRLAKYIAPLCRKLICVDISDKMLNEATANLRAYRNIVFTQFNGVSFDVDVSSVDYAYSYATLCYFSEPIDLWRTVTLIDDVVPAFCLHFHRQVNEHPDPSLSIECVEGGDIYSVQAYRPSTKTIKKQYPDPRYWIERRRPDVRGREPFLYKSQNPPRGLLDRIQRRMHNIQLRLEVARLAHGLA